MSISEMEICHSQGVYTLWIMPDLCGERDKNVENLVENV